MNAVDQATQTQLKNIQTRSGKSLPELYELIRASGLEKHGELVSLLKRDLALGHGDANLLVHCYKRSGGEADAPTAAPEPSADVVDTIYAGKESLRPIHDRVMAAIEGLGEFEIAPKKTYLSLRRKRQFAMVGPATKTRVEVGLNMKGVPATDRLEALPPGGMCQYRVKLTEPDQVDEELLGWIRQAYEAAA